MTSSALDAN